MTELAAERVLCADALSLALTPDAAAEGAATRSAALGELGATEVGLWEIDAGEASDIEVDEIFVVLSGSGTVTFQDGSQIDLAPGVVVRLHAGDRTRWTIREPLRKVYVIG